MFCSAPRCRDIAVEISGSFDNGYQVEFTPQETGAHELYIEYGGLCIPCSPFIMMAYDVSRIKVMGVKDGMIGCPGCFIG